MKARWSWLRWNFKLVKLLLVVQCCIALRQIGSDAVQSLSAPLFSLLSNWSAAGIQEMLQTKRTWLRHSLPSPNEIRLKALSRKRNDFYSVQKSLFTFQTQAVTRVSSCLSSLHTGDIIRESERICDFFETAQSNRFTETWKVWCLDTSNDDDDWWRRGAGG